MFKRIDRSPALARFLENLSASLAKQRGLPIALGVLLVAISFVVQLDQRLQPVAGARPDLDDHASMSGCCSP